MRALSLVFLIVISGLARGQSKLGEPRELGPDLRVPASIPTPEIATTPFGDGYLTFWMGGIVRFDAAGDVIRRFSLTSYEGLGRNLLAASNGTDALLGWTLAAGAESAYRLLLLEDGAHHKLTHLGAGSLDAFLFDGRNYLAIVGGLNDRAQIVQLDRRGFTLASASLGIGPSSSDPRTWRNGFFVDGGVAWLVTVVNGRVSRLALTDATGTPQRPQLDTPSFELPFRHHLVSAGHIDGRWYFVHGEPGTNTHFVRFLDSQAPIVIEGFAALDPRGTRVSHGELWLFGLGDTEPVVLRGVRVSPSRRVRSFDVASGGQTWVIGTVAVPRGVLVVSGSAPGPATASHVPLAARLVRTLGFGERTFVRPPTVLHWERANQSDVSVVVHGTGFLTAWHQPSLDGVEVWSRLVDRNGKPIGQSRAAGHGTSTKVASNGHVALLVWSRAGLIRARRVDAEGVPVGEVVTLEQATTNTVILGAGWDGAQFSIAWMDETTISTAAVSSAGEVLFVEPVRIPRPATVSSDGPSFATSPFGALLVWGDGEATNSVMAMALGRDLRPLGPSFRVAGIPTQERRVVWAGEHYVVTFTQDTMLRGARVTPSGVSLDAPWGIWLNQSARWVSSRHRAAYANGRLLVFVDNSSVVTDRNFRNHVLLPLSGPLPYDTATLAMRDDGATVLAYAEFRNGVSTALVRTVE